MNREERRRQARPSGPPTVAAADAARAAGRLGEAEAIYRALLAKAPGDGRALHGLGIVAIQAGHAAAAVPLLERAAASGAGAAALVDLGLARGLVGDRAGAIRAERQAIEIDPANAQAHYNLACDLQDELHLVEAIAHFRQAVALAPGHVDARNNLAQALVAVGEVEAGIEAFDAAVAAAPGDAALASNRLLALHYDPRIAPAALAAEHRGWTARHARQGPLPPPDLDRDPDRPLRIGYLSPDLCRHPVGWFLLKPLAHRDRAAFHVTAYSSRRAEDDVTARIRGLVDRWRPVAGLADDRLAAQIRADGIDLLIDLAGHTMGHRLAVMARRPAPLQASWIGWIDTTGLAAIDHLVTDAVEAPDGEDDRFAEAVVRLPVGAMCYQPPDDAPEIAPPPSARGAPPTLGCFNNLSKLNDGVVALWSRVLRAAPGARLLLKSKTLADPDVAAAWRSRFLDHGIAAERLVLEGRSAHRAMLARYGDVDLALDPFPYSGGLTSVEALWMGVPVITLAGDRMVARQTAGYLTTIGRREWIAGDADAYVAAAVALLADEPARIEARTAQRARMAATPLVDGAAFTAAYEAALRTMWRRRCAATP